MHISSSYSHLFNIHRPLLDRLPGRPVDCSAAVSEPVALLLVQSSAISCVGGVIVVPKESQSGNGIENINMIIAAVATPHPPGCRIGEVDERRIFRDRLVCPYVMLFPCNRAAGFIEASISQGELGWYVSPWYTYLYKATQRIMENDKLYWRIYMSLEGLLLTYRKCKSSVYNGVFSLQAPLLISHNGQTDSRQGQRRNGFGKRRH